MIDVRIMATEDVPNALRLMRKLAVFEGYIDDFRVTEAALEDGAFAQAPSFTVFVVGAPGEPLLGYAVTHQIAWTYTLKPTIVLKELYVVEGARNRGVGEALFQRVVSEAKASGAASLEWLVLPDNHRAKAFYRRLGAKADTSWERWGLSVDLKPDAT